MSRWFRWYEGTTEDGKFRVAARMSRVTVRDVLALWAFMLEDAGHLDHRGVCVRNEDFMASVLDFEDGVVETILSAMQDVGMVSIGHGAITVCNWGKRQFEGDADPTAAERQRRKRDRDKSVTHAPVTRDSRPPETEADTDSETEKKDIRAVPEANEDFERFKRAYPKRKGSNPWPPARKLFEEAVRKGVPPEEIICGAKRFAEEEKSNVGTPYIPQAVKWLRNCCWADGQPLAEQSPEIQISPGTPEWLAWRRHHEEAKQPFMVRMMDQRENERRSLGFPSEWPPGCEPLQAAE